ncbi:hypothetical protein ES708_12306 [subsurface metagenome]
MRNTSVAILIVILLTTLACSTLSAQDLPTAKPEKVGLSSERLEKVDTFVESIIAGEKIAGAVTLVARHGKVAQFKTYGMMDRESGAPMRTDTIFRMASMTKPLTCAAAMSLYEDGLFLLSDSVSMYIPEFANPMVLVPKSEENPNGPYTVPAEREITIRNLMNHTSGLTYRNPLLREYYEKAGVYDRSKPENTIGDMVRAIATAPLLFNPGDDFEYSMSQDVLGYLIEVVSGKTFAEVLRDRITEPLGMTDTFFYVPEEKLSRLVTLYRPNGDGGLDPAPKRPTETAPFGKRTYYSGGGGLYSTIGDYARFAQMILNGGELDGVSVLGKKTVELMMTNSIVPDEAYSAFRANSGDKYGLGFGIRTERGEYDDLESIGTVMWDGAHHTRFWIDPEEDMIGIFMSQLSPRDWRLPGLFRNTVYQAIVE